ncbi:MAG: ATPase [Micavibrio sp.]|nr:ATPase [Micavibrio sp.]
MVDLFGDKPEGLSYDDEFEDDDLGYNPDFDSNIDLSEAEEFQAPRLMSFCEGFEEIEKSLLAQFKAERLHHGLIFSGPKGIGKATFAYRLTRFLLKYGALAPNETDMFGAAPEIPDNFDVSREDRVFSQVASGGHVDLYTVERAYDEDKGKYAAGVAVGDIRKVVPFLHLTSSYGGWRIVIIDDADTMNRNAQNALLKILEEPPEKTLLILVTHRLGALIPTIRSRTQLLNFATPSRAIFEKLMSKYDPHISPNDVDTLHALSHGSFGDAVAIKEEQGLETLQQILKLFAHAPNFNWEDVHKLSAQFGKGSAASNEYKHFTELMVWIYTQIITAKARGRSIDVNALRIASIDEMMRYSSLEKLIETCDNLKRLFLEVERANLDKKQAVLRAFSIIAA